MKFFLFIVLTEAHNFGPIPEDQPCGYAKDNCRADHACAGPFTNINEWKYLNDEQWLATWEYSSDDDENFD